MIGRRATVASVVAGGAVAAFAACYSTGEGTAPPADQFYFPVALAVSPRNNVLYAVNSDFDLQWNGGTVQAYDLTKIREDVKTNIVSKGQDPNVPYYRQFVGPDPNACPNTPPPLQPGDPAHRQPLGGTCAPPTHSETYHRSSVVIGAFATEAKLGPQLGDGTQRLYIPVRGDTSLTWVRVTPNVDADLFALQCGQGADNRCDANHHAGVDPNDNSRNLTMPGEPFGMALSQSGESIAITHQNDTLTSLFETDLTKGADGRLAPRTDPDNLGKPEHPSLAFIANNLPLGGNGIVAVPHDPDAYLDLDPKSRTYGQIDASKVPRDAFLETSRTVAEVDLLRYYPDQAPLALDGGAGSVAAGGDAGDGGTVDAGAQNGAAQGTGQTPASSLHRPFLVREAAYPLTATAGGTDSRGIVIDDTPRRYCKWLAQQNGPPPPETLRACARLPARLFIANRAPASLVVGQVGVTDNADQTYDADRVVLSGNVPLTAGPSNLYLAPIVDANGNLALRVFIVCFDSATLFVYDPEAGQVENIIRVGQGPFAMAFDSFDLDAVAQHAHVDPVAQPQTAYQYGYVASFTQSFVQVLHLDARKPETFERIVFTLGLPTLPKGSQ